MSGLFGRLTWRSLGVTMLVMGMLLGITTILFYNDIIKYDMLDRYTPIICGISSMVGSVSIAAGNDKRLIRIMLVTVLQLSVIWLITLLCNWDACVDRGTLIRTFSIFAGGILGGMVAPTKRKSSRGVGITKKSKRMVT